MTIVVTKNSWGMFNSKIGKAPDTMYLSVQFKKGTEPQGEKITVEIKDAFFATYRKRDGTILPKLIIMDYELKGDETRKTEEHYEYNYDDENFCPF